MISYELIHRNGKQCGETVTVDDKRLVIGRSTDCDVVLPTPDVSRKHCILVRHVEGVYIRDLSSRNGTKVNGADIAHAKAVKLKHRDKVQVGRWKFRLIEHTGSSLVQPTLPSPSQEGVGMPNVMGLASDGESNADSSWQGDLLDELDAIAALLQINVDDTPQTRAATTVRDIDGAQSKEANKAATVVDKNNTVTQAGSGSSQNPARKENPPANESSEREPKEEPKEEEKRQPTKLPSHLRPQGPIDSQDAAEQALRRMFGS